jgi:transposase
MGYKVGVDKKQLSLLPASLDDYIPENHICRVIDAYTRKIDMVSLGYKHAECKKEGSPPYDPRMMLNLYIYGYLHRVRSTRRLEAETTRNIEVMWLVNELKPDDRTICNFRKDNTHALKQTFREFVRICRELRLYGGELTATDSTKFRANNSRKNNHNEITVERELTRIDKQINEYLKTLEEADKEEAWEKAPDTESLKAALEHLRQWKETVEVLHKRVTDDGEVSTVDPDARLMHSGGDARSLDVCYNVQTIVDSKHHLIIDFEVTNNADDTGNLKTMTEKAKEILGVESFMNLADKGYYDGEDIVACERGGVKSLVAKKRAGGAKKAEGYSIRDFDYDKEQDIYICPNQNLLGYVRNQKCDGREYRVYSNIRACEVCPVKDKCKKSPYRQIFRLPYQDELDIVDERTRSNKTLYRKRSEIVEHPFGTIKAVWGFKQFLCRTKPKVTAETALAYMAYNMRRAVNIFIENRENLVEVLS